MLRRELGLGGVSTTNVEESPGLLGPTPQTEADEQDSTNQPNGDDAKVSVYHQTYVACTPTPVSFYTIMLFFLVFPSKLD